MSCMLGYCYTEQDLGSDPNVILLKFIASSGAAINQMYQFEPIASDSSTVSDTEVEDDDSGVEDRLRSRDW